VKKDVSDYTLPIVSSRETEGSSMFSLFIVRSRVKDYSLGDRVVVSITVEKVLSNMDNKTQNRIYLYREAVF
jgi:hypothetical protein